MPTRTSHPHGTPSWVDLATPDPAAAKEFYGRLFGWSWEDNPMEGTDAVYSMALVGGRSAAAVAPQQMEQVEAGIPPLWQTYLTVDDLEAAVERAGAAGGTVMMPPFDVMTFGRMAVLVDPAGAVFMLWSPLEHIGAEVVNEPGALTWNELVTPDPAAVADFYGAVLGWTAQHDELAPGFAYTTWMRADGEGIAGAMAPPVEGMPAFWGVYFAVEDADATCSAAEAAGATVLAAPMDIPPGRMATLADPQGAVFNIIALAEPGR